MGESRAIGSCAMANDALTHSQQKFTTEGQLCAKESQSAFPKMLGPTNTRVENEASQFLDSLHCV